MGPRRDADLRSPDCNSGNGLLIRRPPGARAGYALVPTFFEVKMSAEELKEVEMLVIRVDAPEIYLSRILPKIAATLSEYAKDKNSKQTARAMVDLFGETVTAAAHMVNEGTSANRLLSKLTCLIQTIDDEFRPQPSPPPAQKPPPASPMN